VIEVLSTARCTECDICVRVCPTNVFDAVEGTAPVIARQSDCQTCFQCEAYCPADALFVAPLRAPAPADSPWVDEAELERSGEFGRYRAQIGWGKAGVPNDPDAALQVLALMTAQLSALLSSGAPSAPAPSHHTPSHQPTTPPKEHSTR